ncbi:MAG: acyl-CoA thioester hydrolase [Limisphaerales bacterium]|jgi:acyl-CoA thioester hydrolase
MSEIDLAPTRLLYRVPYADTDQMGVVYYANFFVYFERVRNEVLRDMGVTYKELEARGIFLPVLESYCRYLQPARYDDLLEIRGRFERVGRTRVKAHAEVSRDGVLLATGHTVHACLSAETGRPIRLPADVFKTSPASDQE